MWFVANGKTGMAAMYSIARQIVFADPCGSPQHRLSRSSYHIGISFWRCERGYFKYDLTMSMTSSAATICCEDGLCFPLRT